VWDEKRSLLPKNRGNELESSSLLTRVRSFILNCYQKVKNWIVETTPIPDSFVRSYLFLRSGIGIIGVALPPVLITGAIILNRRFDVSDSLSAYYYSVTGSVFVGSLWAIGIFLICYQYDHLDDIVSNIAGFCVIVVSLLPTTPTCDPKHPVCATQLQETIGNVHFLFATVFLAALAIMAFLFARESPEKDKVTDRKRKWLYRICGSAMILFIGLAALILLVPNLSGKWQHQYHPILIIETLEAWAFGIAWFVKGETFGRLTVAISSLLPAGRRNEVGRGSGDVTGDTNRASGDSGTGKHAELRDKSSGLNIGHSCWTARSGTWVP